MLLLVNCKGLEPARDARRNTCETSSSSWREPPVTRTRQPRLTLFLWNESTRLRDGWCSCRLTSSPGFAPWTPGKFVRGYTFVSDHECCDRDRGMPFGGRAFDATSERGVLRVSRCKERARLEERAPIWASPTSRSCFGIGLHSWTKNWKIDVRKLVEEKLGRPLISTYGRV
jgi:hypothetical protein